MFTCLLFIGCCLLFVDAVVVDWLFVCSLFTDVYCLLFVDVVVSCLLSIGCLFVYALIVYWLLVDVIVC